MFNGKNKTWTARSMYVLWASRLPLLGSRPFDHGPSSGLIPYTGAAGKLNSAPIHKVKE